MKLFVLNRITEYGWDEFGGFVVRAETEEQARNFAAHEWHAIHGDDRSLDALNRTHVLNPVWTNPEESSCTELTSDGPLEIILGDFNAG